jgi:hypothetical protein
LAVAEIVNGPSARAVVSNETVQGDVGHDPAAAPLTLIEIEARPLVASDAVAVMATTPP